MPEGVRETTCKVCEREEWTRVETSFPKHAKDRLSGRMRVHRRGRSDSVWNEMEKRKQAKSPGENSVTTRTNRSRCVILEEAGAAP